MKKVDSGSRRNGIVIELANGNSGYTEFDTWMLLHSSSKVQLIEKLTGEREPPQNKWPIFDLSKT